MGKWLGGAFVGLVVAGATAAIRVASEEGIREVVREKVKDWRQKRNDKKNKN